MRPHFAHTFSFCFAIGTVLVTGLTGCTAGAGVAVTVTNATGGEISKVQIKFTGGSKSATKLKAAETFKTKVNPSASSHLVVEFADSSGKEHSAKVDVYLERNYSGVIRITIQPDGKVTWKDETKI